MSVQSERILEKIKEKDMSYGELSKLTGIAKSALQRYATGETAKIPLDRIESIAHALNISPAYIMGWSDDIRPTIPSNITKPDKSEKYVEIPIVGRVAAGISCFTENNIVDYEPIEARDIQDGEDYAFLRVIGDSMYPEFKEGDLVLVRCQTSVDSGSYAVVIIDGEDGVIKKVVYGQNWIELHSINPMYPVRRFENEDVLRIRVFGLVKQIKRKF